ncbi:MAG: hypothetical protein JWP63_1690, partial [Candidatus Solibacter sp.]|nr:hypothetical protein [Candidatus Solibacter sp.]
KQTSELEALIAAGEWGKAAELSRALKDAVTDARNRSMAASANELADAVLQWLPVDTQTLVVAQQPFSIDKPDPTKLPTALTMAQGYVVGLLYAAEKNSIVDTILGRTVRFAALAARRFRHHPGDEKHGLPLGMIAYQGCAVYAFSEPLPESLVARPSEDSVMGHRVWVSTGTQSDLRDSETYFVSLLQPDLLAVCNDRAFLQQLVSRKGFPQKDRALPAGLPEWKQLDRSAPLWAISHYPADGSFVGLLGLTTDGVNNETTGIAVEFGLNSGTTRARIIAKSDPWKRLAASPDFHGACNSRQVTNGVWELTVTGRPDAAGMSAFALMATLGFIILL